MNTAASPTVVAAFTTVTSTNATRPLITYYDDATAERTELSAATLANWVAKTANLLVDGLGLGPGDVAAVALPPHWQTAAVLLGCWSAGLAVQVPPATGTPAAVGFAAADRLDQVDAGDRYALALDPFAMGFRSGPPDGTLDFSVEVRGHGDHFPPAGIGPDTLAWADGGTHGDLVAAARQRIVPADRVLIDADLRPDPLDWLVAPLLHGASIVLCRHLKPTTVDTKLAAERATRW
jgi:uncharacterized protein (TIGR03089 family)